MGEVEILQLAAFYTVAFILLIELVGLLWALPGGLICGLIARLRRLPVEPYISAGAGYSAVLFLPWVYLFVRMATGKSPPTFLVFPFYVLVYVIWLILWTGFYYAASSVAAIYDIFVSRSLPLALAILSVVVSLIVASLSLFTIWISLKGLLRRYKTGRAHPQRAAICLPDPGYLVPFIWLLAWSLLNTLVLFISVLGMGDR